MVQPVEVVCVQCRLGEDEEVHTLKKEKGM